MITYRPADVARPVVCELNDLEVFSCVLGLEEETALSIVEPAAVAVTLLPERVLSVSAPALRLRLSYHDMRMFASMLHSLPAQARAALSGEISYVGRSADFERILTVDVVLQVNQKRRQSRTCQRTACICALLVACRVARCM